MSREGEYAWDCSEEEQDRLKPIIQRVIEDLRKPKATVGHVGSVPRPVIYEPGDPRWFDQVLARLQNEGYEHVVIDTA
jgi:hypothetical protein